MRHRRVPSATLVWPHSGERFVSIPAAMEFSFVLPRSRPADDHFPRKIPRSIPPRPPRAHTAQVGLRRSNAMISRLHSQGVFPRRRRVLVERIASLIPAGSTVLDVGTGDGSIAAAIQEAKPGITVSGIDVLVRSGAAIPVAPFDGVTMPYPDKSFDVVLFVDVLHHTADPQALLNESARVARAWVIIKDHNRDGFLAAATLRFMDRVGNARFGVALPYNYLSKAQWNAAYERAGLEVAECQTKIGLYPFWANWLFGRGLHSVVLLRHKSSGSPRLGPGPGIAP
jgi:SAM-dependent methyltransferase